MKRSLLLLVVVPWLCVNGCSNTPAATDGKLHVTVTTSLLADAVKQIGGEHVLVESIITAGGDPHSYSPSPADLTKLNKADLILYHGLHLEGKMDDVLANVKGRKSVAVCEKIPEKQLRHAQGGDGPHDPHVWMNPVLWIEVVKAVAAELALADPAHKAVFEANAERFVHDITKLDTDNKAAFTSLPATRRLLVTSHDAFAYFGAHYELQVRGLQGVSTASETSSKDVAELAAFLGTNKVPAVFTETSVPPKGLEAVLDAVKSKYNHHVKLIGGENALYSDSLGEAGTPGETYLGMIRHNVKVIVDALK